MCCIDGRLHISLRHLTPSGYTLLVFRTIKKAVPAEPYMQYPFMLISPCIDLEQMHCHNPFSYNAYHASVSRDLSWKLPLLIHAHVKA